MDPHLRIQNIGGIVNGVPWRRTQPDAITDVRNDASSYFVSDRAGHTVWVIVRLHNGNPYLTTEPDGDTQNNLLALDDAGDCIVGRLEQLGF